MIELIQGIIDFIKSVLISPFVDLVNDFREYISSVDVAILPSNIKSFMGSAITLFIPVNAIVVCLSLLIPYYLIVLTIKIVLRVKSFIPSMGGK